ncbi:calponin homology domain-containing protein [Lipomyces tetrasporus]|uniref:Calponin homology domain-containing protein n=1 Tax=Lipomyces tetrasporus TaxID=54092 RepID=A0AAD7QRY4_9ASCO|nr:calponin homology domain-containing protein [Lipomyces tetrasporus]KAJ8100340.1 calponin homology domain-containing protein [Lipomyces tetrasporus]
MASVTSLDQDMAELRKSKYDAKSATEAKAWIEELLGESLGPEDLIDLLRDGVILCRLVNIVMPTANLKYKSSRMPFVQMENISMFLRAAASLGLPQYDLFQTVDLYEAKDPAQVLQTLYSFSRHANKQNPAMPLLGPKLATKRESPINHPKQGVDIPAWNTHQYGYMGGASQGSEKVVFSKRRDIVYRP